MVATRSKPTISENRERSVNAIDPTKVKKNDIVLVSYWSVVDSPTRQGSHLNCRNLDHEKPESTAASFSVNGRGLVERCFSADQFEEEIKLTRTKVAEVLITCYNKPFTVCFEKVDGTERVLRGRLIRPEPLLGRSEVEDLDEPPKDRRRLVDHRTIKYLIVEGTKYTVKA